MSSVLEMVGRSAAVAPSIDCWSWNVQHGHLSARDSAMPGRWRPELSEHWHYWHDVISARRLGRTWKGAPDSNAYLTESIWCVAAAQTLKTRSLLYAAMGYAIDQHPAPSAFILPRLKDFKRVLKNRLRPLFEDMPQLARHLPRGIRERKENLSFEAWTLDTMTMYMLCGELPDDLRQFPIRDLYLDEPDNLSLEVGEEGDPIEIVSERQKTWPRSKLTTATTTPTTVAGQGWRRLCQSTHQRLLIKCPACEARQELHPDQLVVPDASPDEIKIMRLAKWACKHCGNVINDDGTKDRLVTESRNMWIPGNWEVTAESPGGLWTPAGSFDGNGRLLEWQTPKTTRRSLHLNGLYSPITSLSEFAAKERYVKEKGGREQWVTFQNTWRCEPTIPAVTKAPSLSTILVSTGGSSYAHGEFPEGPKHLALICDQQGNQRQTSWFPYGVFGYGPGMLWLGEAGEMTGFESLDGAELRRFAVGNKVMTCEVAAVDGNNGTMRVPLQQFAAAKPASRLLMAGRAFPAFMFQQRIAGGRSERRNKSIITGARIFAFHANAYKTEADQCLRGTNPRLKLFLPDDAPDMFMKSMSSEEVLERDMRLPGMQSKRRVAVWEPRVEHKPDGTILVRSDNHWWDTLVMAIVLGDINGWFEDKEGPKQIAADDWFKNQKRKTP